MKEERSVHVVKSVARLAIPRAGRAGITGMIRHAQLNFPAGAAVDRALHHDPIVLLAGERTDGFAAG